MPQYLSTDPNAGLGESRYLSTDPNAGLGMEPIASHGTQSPAKRNLIQEQIDLLEQGEGSGLIGGALSVVGKAAPLINRGVSEVAKRLYSSVLKPKDKTLEQFPNVVEDLIRDRRIISQAGRKRAIQSRKVTGGEKGDILRQADASGRTIPRETIRAGLDDTLESSITSSPTPPKDLGKLARLERDLLPDEAVLSPSRTDAIKQTLQSEAERGLRQAKMGTRVNDLTMRARMSMADKAKTATEAAAEGFTAGGRTLAETNKRYASLKGQGQALKEALKREGNTHVIGMRDLIGGAGGASIGGPGGGIGGVMLMRLLAQPNAASRIAIGINDASRLPLDEIIRNMLVAGKGHQ